MVRTLFTKTRSKPNLTSGAHSAARLHFIRSYRGGVRAYEAKPTTAQRPTRRKGQRGAVASVEQQVRAR
ncbi:hypothetical protein OPT61_g5268 [Boeremia exigua]|uniref:Uncharacterized protein n=1 Tax=Boeremia exigua TaxID=749465 RepID=A0ACC2IB37_9PLEO|nr:hypothetical protein OPT61_g5268 [Boeremia exigua]